MAEILIALLTYFFGNYFKLILETFLLYSRNNLQSPHDIEIGVALRPPYIVVFLGNVIDNSDLQQVFQVW